MKCIYDLLQKCHKGCPEVECYNYDKVNEGVIDNEQPLEMIKFDKEDKCHWEDGCKADFFEELVAPYEVDNMQEFKAAIRAEVVDEFKTMFWKSEIEFRPSQIDEILRVAEAVKVGGKE